MSKFERLLILVLTIVGIGVLSVVGAALLLGDDEVPAPTLANEQATSIEPSGETEEPLPALISLSSSSCEDEYPVVMQPQADGTVRLVAEAYVANDGDAKGEASVTARWLYFGGGSIALTKNVEVFPGREVRVPFTKIVSQEEGLRMVGHQAGDEFCRIRLAARP